MPKLQPTNWAYLNLKSRKVALAQRCVNHSTRHGGGLNGEAVHAPQKMQPLLPDNFEKQQGMYECGYGQPNNVAIAI